jgi:acyl-CoA synthetase (AMP-forming)/AMP-acid ligase II
MLVDLLTNGKASHPAISVVDGPSINYGELARQVDDLSKTLGTLGLGKSDRIAMALTERPRSNCIISGGFFGGTAAPLNPAYTRDEFRFYLEDTNARALIVPAKWG